MSSKPTFIFVPGAWHGPEIYSAVRKILTSHGYPSVAVALPSIGASPGLPDFSADVCAIKTAVREQVEEEGEEKEVVLVMHSYGGCPGSESLEGLGMKERGKAGKKGGVVRLVFLAAYVLGEGEKVAAEAEDPKRKEVRKYLDGHVTIPDARKRFYNDLDDQTAAYWVSQLQPQSVGPFKSKVSYAAWKHIPSTYLICERDNALSLREQEAFAKRTDMVERCDSSHSPFLSQPEFVVGVLRRAAGERV